MCDNGELVNVTCPGGTTFSEDDLDCIDASLNPECDIDECLEFINFPDTQTECDSKISISTLDSQNPDSRQASDRTCPRRGQTSALKFSKRF